MPTFLPVFFFIEQLQPNDGGIKQTCYGAFSAEISTLVKNNNLAPAQK